MSIVTVGAHNSSPLSHSKSASTTCASLLSELQGIWDEIGESETERDKMLFQLEQECLDIYRRKVERSRKHKAELLQSMAEFEAEIARLTSALGERVSLPRKNGDLKHQISLISPTLESLRLKRLERLKEISEVEFQIAVISAEIAGSDQNVDRNGIQVDELDLTTNKLGELKSHLQELQYEKNLRLQKVTSHMNAIHGLSVVMSLDFKAIMAKIHPSFVDNVDGQSKSISNEILARLTSEMNSLKQEKEQRLQQVHNYSRKLMELWSLMDTPVEERERFDRVVCLITSTADEVVSPGSLSVDVIEQTEVEIERLSLLKATKLKELIFKRQSELEEIYKGVHMDIDFCMLSGSVDLSDLLSSMDDQIAKAQEQAQSRKDILERVEKWKHASEEEIWLDEYERDENRYSAGRGVHKNLKRAEKARILVSKIPSLVEVLIAKVQAWEQEKGMPFMYNKAPLLQTLDDFVISRRVKEEEKRRSREQKKLQDQLATEQEALFGSKPRSKKPLGQSTNANTMAATPTGRRLGVTPARFGVSGGSARRDSVKVGNAIPINYVALPKDD